MAALCIQIPLLEFMCSCLYNIAATPGYLQLSTSTCRDDKLTRADVADKWEHDLFDPAF